MNPKNHNNSIVKERIEKLFLNAKEQFSENTPESIALSKRYIVLARKLSTRYKVKFTSDQKKLFCKKCNSYLKIGSNSKVRISNNNIVQSCLLCKNVRRIGLSK
jgi:ribonuclease P protein subunit RPR2